MADTSTDRIAQAIGDPGSILSRDEHETVTRWSTRAVEAVLQNERSFSAMYAHTYFGIAEVLDGALGTEEEDGAGQGIVADVMLLAYRYELALKALRAAGADAIAEVIGQADLTEPGEQVSAVFLADLDDQADTNTLPNPSDDDR